MPPPDIGFLHFPPPPPITLACPQAASGTRTVVGSQEGWLTRIAVRSLGRIVIVPVQEIVRLEAEDNYVRIWADRPYLHKDTLTGMCAKLDPAAFLRVHRSHAINLRLVRELHPQQHGEFRIVLATGAAITSGRSYRGALHRAFGLGRGARMGRRASGASASNRTGSAKV